MASFEGALSESEELLLLLSQSKDAPTSVQVSKLDSLLSTTASCRGFFVVLLTGDSKLAEEAPSFLLDAIRKSSIAHELLVKNLVMSSATRLVHLRRHDVANAEGSAVVSARSSTLIKSLAMPELQNCMREMISSLKTKQGRYADFVARCSYDDEQIGTACNAIDKLL